MGQSTHLSSTFAHISGGLALPHMLGRRPKQETGIVQHNQTFWLLAETRLYNRATDWRGFAFFLLAQSAPLQSLSAGGQAVKRM